MHCSKPGDPDRCQTTEREREGDTKASRQTQPTVFIPLTSTSPHSPFPRGIIHPSIECTILSGAKIPSYTQKGPQRDRHTVQCRTMPYTQPRHAAPMPCQSRFPDQTGADPIPCAVRWAMANTRSRKDRVHPNEKPNKQTPSQSMLPHHTTPYHNTSFLPYSHPNTTTHPSSLPSLPYPPSPPFPILPLFTTPPS